MRLSYSELITYTSFIDRFKYLKLDGSLGTSTFGFDRYLNQRFYTSKEWRDIRTFVIARDLGRDLGVEGYDIHSKILIHHMNPLRPNDLIHGSSNLIDPENLITTTHTTHNAIHFGDESALKYDYIPRRPGDTTLWSPMSHNY